MNQKSITNQILTRELSLNSTLNYLFNISNMKKLFTYLLISSMVVLSSCTNYDDQFDDLNSQLSTLKTQIDGFTALSSGVTALQGTVSSLQAAVAALPKTATPATDISGLQTALTALAATVAELKTALAGAATSSEVATLAANLAAAQTDLSELLASNNVYTGDLTINTASTLTAAEALGGKVGIINGNVVVTQSASNGLDAAKLQAVVEKMITITGYLNYTQSGTGVTAVNFSKLSGVSALTLNQEAPIAMAELSSAAAVALTANSKVTSVSFPKLATVTSFNTLVFTSATEIDLASLKYYAGALTLTTKNNGSVHLHALENVDANGVATSFALTVNSASELMAPKLTAGVVTANNVDSVSLPLWTGETTSSFAAAKTVVFPKITAATAADKTFVASSIFPAAENIHMIAAAKGTKTVTLTVAQNNVKVLKLEGAFKAVTITAATRLTSLDLTATTGSLQVTNTNMATLTIGSTLAEGTLTVTDNGDLESIVGATVNKLNNLTITGNANLTSVSMAALVAAGATKGAVKIEKNNLVIDKITEKSLTDATVTVARKVETTDFKPLVAFLTSAKAAGSSVIAKATNTTPAALVTAVVTALGADTTVKVGDEIIMNWIPSAQDSDFVSGKNHVEEWLFIGIDQDVDILMDGFSTKIVNTGGSVFNDVQSWADLDANKTKFTNGGYAVTYGRSVSNGDISITAGAAASATYKLVVNSKTVTTTVNDANPASDKVMNALAAALAASNSDVATSLLYAVSTATGKLKFQTLRKGSPAPTFSYALSAYEDAALTTNTSNAVFSATVNALAKDNDQVWVQLAATTAGAAGIKATSVYSTGVFTRISLTASGTNANNFATGDDNTAVQSASSDTAESTGSANDRTNASVDNTAEIG